MVRFAVLLVALAGCSRTLPSPSAIRSGEAPTCAEESSRPRNDLAIAAAGAVIAGLGVYELSNEDMGSALDVPDRVVGMSLLVPGVITLIAFGGSSLDGYASVSACRERVAALPR
jgi:hypothetical protein